MNIDLPQNSFAGVHESMRSVRGDDNDAARFHLACFISDRDRGGAFDGERDLDVRLFVQKPNVNDVLAPVPHFGTADKCFAMTQTCSRCGHP